MGGQDNAGPLAEGISLIADGALAQGVAVCAVKGGRRTGCVECCAILAESVGANNKSIDACLAEIVLRTANIAVRISAPGLACDECT